MDEPKLKYYTRQGQIQIPVPKAAWDSIGQLLALKRITLFNLAIDVFTSKKLFWI